MSQANEQDVLARDRLRGENPMDFLGHTLHTLKMSHNWNVIVHIGIIVDNPSEAGAWRPRSVPALAKTTVAHVNRAVLILQSAECRNYWELVKGILLTDDGSIEAAIDRIVAKHTGLRLLEVLGGIVPVDVLDPCKQFEVAQIKLSYAVSVTEIPVTDHFAQNRPSHSRSSLPVIQRSTEYIGERWLSNIQALNTMGPFVWSDKQTIRQALEFRKETWPTTIEYLAMNPSRVPYTDRYKYNISAAIIRTITGAGGTPSVSGVESEDASGSLCASTITHSSQLPTLLLVRRGEAKGERTPGNWEFPGGRLHYDDSLDPSKAVEHPATIEAALRATIQYKTGLSIKNILGIVYEHPRPVPARPDLSYQERGFASLIYLVTVEGVEREDARVLDAPIKLEEGYDALQWVESLEQATTLSISMNRWAWKTLAIALEAAKDAVQQGKV